MFANSFGQQFYINLKILFNYKATPLDFLALLNRSQAPLPNILNGLQIIYRF